ncbi:chorismate-binding protein [Streptomyces sp. RPT161]|uniref:chorismate-binding protein n=1 Tax=Streptomyces sp. RPT161 TaxID=3015993 RepID=UPI003FCEC8E2
MTGAPKGEALAALSRYEEAPRGLYGGAVITADTEGVVDAALVLRTVFHHDGRTWLRAGRGSHGRVDSEQGVRGNSGEAPQHRPPHPPPATSPPAARVCRSHATR